MGTLNPLKIECPKGEYFIPAVSFQALRLINKPKEDLKATALYTFMRAEYGAFANANSDNPLTCYWSSKEDLIGNKKEGKIGALEESTGMEMGEGKFDTTLTRLCELGLLVRIAYYHKGRQHRYLVVLDPMMPDYRRYLVRCQRYILAVRESSPNNIKVELDKQLVILERLLGSKDSEPSPEPSVSTSVSSQETTSVEHIHTQPEQENVAPQASDTALQAPSVLPYDFDYNDLGSWP